MARATANSTRNLRLLRSVRALTYQLVVIDEDLRDLLRPIDRRGAIADQLHEVICRIGSDVRARVGAV